MASWKESLYRAYRNSSQQIRFAVYGRSPHTGDGTWHNVISLYFPHKLQQCIACSATLIVMMQCSILAKLCAEVLRVTIAMLCSTVLCLLCCAGRKHDPSAFEALLQEFTALQNQVGVMLELPLH